MRRVSLTNKAHTHAQTTALKKAQDDEHLNCSLFSGRCKYASNILNPVLSVTLERGTRNYQLSITQNQHTKLVNERSLVHRNVTAD